MTDKWTCHWIRDCVQFISKELQTLDTKAIESWYIPDNWGVVQACKFCRKGDNSSHRRCRGWCLKIWGKNAIVFSPVEVKGSPIRVTLEGTFNTRRQQDWRGDWRPSPISECTVVIKLDNPTTGKLLCRQHLDMANPGQPGPVWHLQLGGIGGGAERDELRSVAMLRWPTIPMDFMLAVELCLYLFHFKVWDDVRRISSWRKFIKDTEELVISHYADLLTKYRDQCGLESSWLAAQCNQQGLLNPRPF